MHSNILLLKETRFHYAVKFVFISLDDNNNNNNNSIHCGVIQNMYDMIFHDGKMNVFLAPLTIQEQTKHKLPLAIITFMDGLIRTAFAYA